MAVVMYENSGIEQVIAEHMFAIYESVYVHNQ